MNLNLFHSSRCLIVGALILLASCTSKKQGPPVTWLNGYGQVQKLNGRVKKLVDERFGHTTAYSFDEKGDLILIEHIFKNGIDTTKCNTVYDRNGKKTGSDYTYTESKKKFKDVYKYDNHELLTRCIGYANDTLTLDTRFIYDKDDNLIEQQVYIRQKAWNNYRFRPLYNKNSVCIGMEQSTATWRDNFRSFFKDTTQYVVLDANKNWLKAVDRSKGVEICTISRKITYY